MKPWKVSLDNPKFTPELRNLLQALFERLAYLNLAASKASLSEIQEQERETLAQFHDDVRFARGIWKNYHDPKQKRTPRKIKHSYNHWPLNGNIATCYQCGIVITLENQNDFCPGQK